MGRFFQVTPTEFQSQFTPLPMEFMYQTIKEKQLEVDNVNKASDIFKQAVKWGRGTEKEGKELTEWLKSRTEDVEKSLSSGDYQTAVSKLSQYNKELKSDWRWHKATQDFHYRDKVDEMLRSASEKGDIATFLDPTGGIRQMEGKSFNPAHYGVVPYADYWGEEFDPQITDKLTASVQAYLSDPNIKVEVINGPNGPVYGYFDRVKNTYEYLDDRHPAVRALFGIDEQGNVDPNKALIRNLYEEGMLGQSKGFNFFDAAYRNKTGERVPYEYFYNKARTRVVPKFYTKEDISGGKFDLFPEYLQGGTDEVKRDTRVLTTITPVEINENTLNTTVQDYKNAVQNFDQSARDVAGVAFDNFFNFTDTSIKGGSNILNYKGEQNNLPSIYEILDSYGINVFKDGDFTPNIHKEKLQAMFASLDIEQQESIINQVDLVLTDALKNLDLTDPKQALTADNIQQLKNSFGSYQSSLNNLSSSGNIIAQNIDNIKESLRGDTEFDNIYRKYETAAKNSKTEVLSKDDLITLLTEIETLSEKSPGFMNVLLSGDYDKFKRWIQDNKGWLKYPVSYLVGLRKGHLAAVFTLYQMSNFNENSSDPKDHMGFAKTYIQNKFKDGSFVTDEDVQYLTTKKGEEHPIVKQLKDLEELNVVSGEENFYLKSDNKTKKKASGLTKDLKITNIGFGASKTDNNMNIFVTHEAKDANGNVYIKTTKKPFKPTSKNKQLYTELVDILVTQQDENKQAEGYRMYANINQDVPNLSNALYLANRKGSENKETAFTPIKHNNVVYQVMKTKGGVKGSPGSFYVLVSSDGGSTYGIVTDSGISQPKKLSEYKDNTYAITQSNGQLYRDGNQALSVIGKFMYMSDNAKKTSQSEQRSGGDDGKKYGQVWRP